MIEFTLHGRGGQGGVTLAKLLAAAYFVKGKHVQAFGVYAAERSGAPVQAFVRVDDDEITNHNQIREPDHVVVLDRTLIGAKVAAGMKPDGWLILNSPEPPEALAAHFPGRWTATVDATGVALAHGLGTRAVPIVNTTMLGAIARVVGLSIEDVSAALDHAKLGGANLAAATIAYESVRRAMLTGAAETISPAAPRISEATILDGGPAELPAIRTGAWASRQPHRRALTPPCNHGCPAGNDVRGFVQAAAEKRYDDGLGILLETSPLPGVCGRVCPAPCMTACNRNEHDEAVNVREIERYLSDHAIPPHPTKPTRDATVAVIGSGPAGLAAAYHLARFGYPVTLFEADRELGGVLRTGIPTYRLPRDVLDREISFILRHGVEARTNERISRERLLEATRRFAAVFVATGLQEARGLQLGKIGADTVLQGVDFLDRVRNGDVYCGGQRVIVIGGGNTAVDAARSALRVGARHAQIVYRRTRHEMPAIHEEIDAALAEGVELTELAAPVRMHTTPTGGVLTVQRMELGPPDASGRRAPTPCETEDAIFELHADRVILALGQSADLSIFPEGADVRDGEQLLGMTSAPVFAGGDFATNEGTVAAAIGSGRRAALHIHKTLTGEDLFDEPTGELAGPGVVTLHMFAHAPQHRGGRLAPGFSRRSFQEVHGGLRDEPGRATAAEEAARCMSCGVCNECDRCLAYCPEGVMVHRGDGRYDFDYDYCKGCGVCASQCPRGVVYMAEL